MSAIERFEELAEMLQILAKLGKGDTKIYKKIEIYLEREARLAAKNYDMQRKFEEKVAIEERRRSRTKEKDTGELLEYAQEQILMAKAPVEELHLTPEQRALDDKE